MDKLYKLKEITAKLNSKEYDLEYFFQLGKDLFCIVSKEGKLIKANKAWLTKTGYTQEELYNVDNFALVHPDDMDKAKEFIKTNNTSANIRIKTKNQGYINIEWNKAWHKDSEYIYIVGKDPLDYFRGFIEVFLDQPILVCDENCKIIMCNKKIYDILGYTWDELIGQPIEILVEPSFRNEHVKLRDSYMKNPFGEKLGCRTLIANKKDGALIHVNVIVTPVDKLNNKINTIVVIHKTE